MTPSTIVRMTIIQYPQTHRHHRLHSFVHHHHHHAFYNFMLLMPNGVLKKSSKKLYTVDDNSMEVLMNISINEHRKVYIVDNHPVQLLI